MNYTDEQFQALAPYADEFRRAIESNYCKHLRTDELKAIRAAYMAATGKKHYPDSFGCTYCVITLMKDAGRLYFADCDERALAAAKREEERKAAEDAKMLALTPASEEQKTKTEEAAAPAKKSAPKKAAKPKAGEVIDEPVKAPETEK